jgi:putative flippase GtrA
MQDAGRVCRATSRVHPAPGTARRRVPRALPSGGVPSFTTILRVVRFAIAGGGSLLVDIGLQGLMRAGLGVPKLVAPVLSYELGLLAHFFMLSLWVFRQPVTSRRLAQFHLSALIPASITLGITYGLIPAQPAMPDFIDPNGPFATYWPEVAKAVGTGTAMLWTFIASFFWIWKKPQVAEGSKTADTAASKG